MNSLSRNFGIREKSELIGKMKEFHAQCLKAKGQVRVYSEEWDALEDMIRKMDDTAQILTGERRFLYIARAYQQGRASSARVMTEA